MGQIAHKFRKSVQSWEILPVLQGYTSGTLLNKHTDAYFWQQSSRQIIHSSRKHLLLREIILTVLQGRSNSHLGQRAAQLK